MSDRHGVNSVFQNDSLVVVCRQCRLVNSFRAHVMLPASDGVHRPREQLIIVFAITNIIRISHSHN